MAKLRKKSRSYYYWRAREVANDLAYRKQDVVHERTMNGYYDYAMDQIQKEIDRFYSKYASAEGITLAEAKKRVSQLDIDEYSRKAKKYVAEKDFTAQANAEMKLYNATMKINRLELLKAKIGLETVAAHSDAEKYLKEILNGRTVQEIKRQAGILGESIGANAKTVNSIVDASFHNAKWSTRIWGNQALLKAELSKILTNGLTQGKSSRELTRELRKAVESSKQNASRLMRTELSRVRNDAQLESIKRNGFEEYMFHTLSSAPFTAAKVCPICADLDGKVFKIKDAVVGDNMPPMHPNCRCSISAYEDEEAYQKWLENFGNTRRLLGAGSEAKPGKIVREDLGKIDPKKITQAIAYYGDLIRHEPIEHALIFEPDGTLTHFSGNALGVDFDMDTLDGAVILHNHPESNGIVSFGPDDFAFLQANPKVKQLIAVNPVYNYYVSILKSIENVARNDLQHFGLEFMDGAGPDDDMEMQHAGYLGLAKRGYVKYERKKVKK